MNFNHKLFFRQNKNLYTLEEFKQLSNSKILDKRLYIEYVLWIGLHSHKCYRSYFNNKIKNLNNNSYKFTDLKFNTHTVIFDSIFPDIKKS